MKDLDILLMLKENSYVTARQLADALQLSEKTIRNMIQKLRAEETRYGVHIHSQTKLGYKLEITDEKNFILIRRSVCIRKKSIRNPHRTESSLS